MQGISPFLWFDNQAEEAARFYTSIFPRSRIVDTMRYPEGGPMPTGTVMTVTFELDGQEFIALNGGPQFTFSPAISFFVKCESQQEVDTIWDKLLAGGQPEQCGWLRDRYGVSWQIVPVALGEMLQDKDPARAQRVMNAMLQMVKIDVDALKRASDQP
jgi:predicted 3-demethylubiquinone-9 3-methyltransferase (glyoxalase superfamily)